MVCRNAIISAFFISKDSGVKSPYFILYLSIGTKTDFCLQWHASFQRKHVDFLVLLRCIWIATSANSPAMQAQTCLRGYRYTRKTAKICLSFAYGSDDACISLSFKNALCKFLNCWLVSGFWHPNFQIKRKAKIPLFLRFLAFVRTDNGNRI